MDFQELEKVKDRIAKLLRMAADASSPNEAAIAVQRARALMDKYQLDEFDVGNRIEEEFAAEQATRFYAAIPGYLDTLAVYVAKYNDCQSRFEAGEVTHKKRKGEFLQMGKAITFLGYKSDVQLAIQMFNYICDTVNALCKSWMNSRGITAYSVRIGTQFKVGACLEIGRRLKEMTIERDAITMSNGSALVVVKKAGVDAKFGEVEYGKKNFRAPDEEDELEAEARQEGEIKGRTVEIVKSVEE